MNNEFIPIWCYLIKIENFICMISTHNVFFSFPESLYITRATRPIKRKPYSIRTNAKFRMFIVCLVVSGCCVYSVSNLHTQIVITICKYLYQPHKETKLCLISKHFRFFEIIISNINTEKKNLYICLNQ